MKLDFDLIRKILLFAEAAPPSAGGIISFEGVKGDIVAYHVSLMQDAHLIEAQIVIASADPQHASAKINRIRSLGQEVIAWVKSDANWNAAVSGPIKRGIWIEGLVDWIKDQVATREHQAK